MRSGFNLSVRILMRSRFPYLLRTRDAEGSIWICASFILATAEGSSTIRDVVEAVEVSAEVAEGVLKMVSTP
jgi:hypothetical protein